MEKELPRIVDETLALLLNYRDCAKVARSALEGALELRQEDPVQGGELREGVEAVDPVVSIIMTSYNNDRFVGAAIKSVLAQTLGDWELLIVDDCSPDDSWDVISGFSDPRIAAFRFDENRGATAAYGFAYSRIRGELVATLDCDDVYHPEKLARQKAFLDLHQEVGICGTYITDIGPDPDTLEAGDVKVANWFNVERDPNDPASWVWENRLCHSSVVVRKSTHELLGPADGSLVYTPDFDYWIRALAAGVRFHIIPEPLTYYRNHGDNLTHKNPQQQRREYAVISGRTFHPYLARIGRTDLIVRNVLPFLELLQPADSDWDAVAALLDVLLPPDSMSDEGSSKSGAICRRRVIAGALMELSIRMKYERDRAEQAEGLYQGRGEWIQELETAVRWNDEQRQLWEARAWANEGLYQGRGEWIQELETAVRWNDEQRQLWEARARELENAIVSTKQRQNSRRQRLHDLLDTCLDLLRGHYGR